MRLVVRGCEEVGGEISPVPSLWSSIITILAAAALGEAEVLDIDTWNPCIDNVLRFLKLLGYNVEKLSSTRLMIGNKNEITKPLITRLSLSCGLLVAEPLSMFFVLNAPPGSRLVLDARSSEYILSVDPRELKELVSVLGARVWRTRNVSQYLVIEKKAAPLPPILRVTTSNGSLIASLLVSLIGSTGPHLPPVRLVAPQLYARDRLYQAKTLLDSIGLSIDMSSNVIRLERASSKSNKLRPVPGIAETLTILSYANPCKVSKIVLRIDTLSSEQLQELLYLTQLIGYDVEVSGNKLKLSKSSPRSVVHSVERAPELAIPLIISAFSVKDSVVSGLRPSILEGLVSRHIEEIGKEFGAEAYLEEDERLRIIKPLGKVKTLPMTCKGLDPASCNLLVYGALANRRRAVIEQAEKAIGIVPFGLEYLQMLGIDISVQKSS